MAPKLSIIIPAYNEEKRILPTLEDYFSFFNKELKDDFEIVIVPNNCSDKTLELCEEFSKGKPQIRILNIPKKIGKGGAVIEGFKIANGNLIGFTDADGATDAENFFKIYEDLKDKEGVIASRRGNGAIVKNRRLSEKVSSYIFNAIVRIFVGLKFRDTQCGAKIFKKDTADFITNNISEKGWIFDVDILKICEDKGLKIKEVPIVWTNKEGTKLKFKDKINSMRRLLLYGVKKGENAKQFIKFGTVGVSNTLVNLAVLYFLTSILGIYYLVSAVAAFLVANFNSFLLNKRWTFKEKIKHHFFSKYIKFLSVSLGSLVVNLAALYLFTSILGIYYLISQIIAIGISLIINFTGNKIWTFRK